MTMPAHIITEQIGHDLLQALVPVNSLTRDHLEALLRNHSVEAVCQGECLFSVGDFDHQSVYLLSGCVTVTDSMGRSKSIAAEAPECRFPIVDHQPRRHSLCAETDCSIIRFDSEQLDAMLAWDQASHYIMLDIASQRDLDEDADWMLTLLNSNLFYKVPPINIRQILNKFVPEYVSAGDTVIRQGELGDCCYFIKEGVVGVYQSSQDKAHSELVAELGVGRCFGEDALVNKDVRNATIKMHENGVLMRLDKQDFFLLLKTPAVDSVTLSEAVDKHDAGAEWIDVRTQEEFDNGHMHLAVNMPLNLLKLKSRMLDKEKHYLVYCNSGRRSEAAAHLLTEEGFSASVLAGGILSQVASDQQIFQHVPINSGLPS